MLNQTTPPDMRDILIKWEKVCISESKNNQIRMLLDGQNLLLFFQFEDNLYGATEQHRITFSKMKSPDEEATPEWIKEANFLAFNLTSALSGSPTQEIFYSKDIDDISVVNKEDAFKILSGDANKSELKQVQSGTKAILNMMKQLKRTSTNPK